MAWSGIRFTDTESWSLDQREDPEARKGKSDLNRDGEVHNFCEIGKEKGGKVRKKRKSQKKR